VQVINNINLMMSYFPLLHKRDTVRDAQLLQRDCAEGCVSFGQKWKPGTGDNIFLCLSSTAVT